MPPSGAASGCHNWWRIRYGVRARSWNIDGVPSLGAATCEKKLLLDLAEALAHRHSEQVVHNDVKPGNVLVFCQEKWRAKLADFWQRTGLHDFASVDFELPEP